MRWGTAKEYGAYYKLLLTDSGRREFRWWLEKENPELFKLFLKEAKIDDRSISQSG
jgi:succinate dehydrogenase flavin-adding protein (antitoxin of CptAB toxin-antitoxin module)